MPSNFTTCVELRGNATPATYEKLNTAMGKEGFIRTLTAGEETFEMPRGEFNMITDLSISAVKEAAVKAANSVSKDFGIVVTQSSGRKWYGLPEL